MKVFFLSIAVFVGLIAITLGIGFFLEGALLRPKTLRDRRAKEIIDQSEIGWLTTVIYSCFVALVFFILATSFSVQFFYQSYAEATYYLFIIFPVAIATALAIYLGAKFLVILALR